MVSYAVQSIQAFFQSGFYMYPIFIVLLVGVIIQFAKVVIDTIKNKRFSIEHIFSSGGFPSFHSGLASSATMLVRLHE